MQDSVYGRTYLITNKTNGKSYVGLTRFSIEKRFEEHVLNSRRKRRISAVCSAILKYGRENFTIKELGTAENKKDLVLLEQKHIIEFKTLSPDGYNLTTGGEDMILSEESKKRLSAALKGRPFSEQHLKNMRKKHKTSGHDDDSDRRRLKARGQYAPFNVYRKDTGEFVGYFEFQYQAIKQLGLKSTTVSRCLKGISRYQSHRGYTFKHAEKS